MGGPQVALHNERLRQQKEVTAMKIVRALVPDLTTAVCKAAITHCKLDGMQAAHLLQDFKRANTAELQALHKVGDSSIVCCDIVCCNHCTTAGICTSGRTTRGQ